MRLLGVLIHSLLGVVAAVILTYQSKYGFYNLLLIYFGVLTIHGVRFVIWSRLVAKNELSVIYPLTSIFYPLIYVTALLIGWEKGSLCKLLGVLLILMGSFKLNRSS